MVDWVIDHKMHLQWTNCQSQVKKQHKLNFEAAFLNEKIFIKYLYASRIHKT